MCDVLGTHLRFDFVVVVRGRRLAYNLSNNLSYATYHYGVLTVTRCALLVGMFLLRSTIVSRDRGSSGDMNDLVGDIDKILVDRMEKIMSNRTI